MSKVSEVYPEHGQRERDAALTKLCLDSKSGIMQGANFGTGWGREEVEVLVVASGNSAKPRTSLALNGCKTLVTEYAAGYEHFIDIFSDGLFSELLE